MLRTKIQSTTARRTTQQISEKKSQSNTATHVVKTTTLMLSCLHAIEDLNARVLTLRFSQSSMWYAVTTLYPLSSLSWKQAPYCLPLGQPSAQQAHRN